MKKKIILVYQSTHYLIFIMMIDKNENLLKIKVGEEG